MRKPTTSALNTTISVIATFLFSASAVKYVEWFVGRFPKEIVWWLRPAIWVVLAACLFGLAVAGNALWRKLALQKSAKREQQTLEAERVILRGIDDLLTQFAKMISRFHKELAQETHPDAGSLRQHMETDDKCYDALRLIRFGPKVSMSCLENQHRPERVMVDTTWQHYEVELRHPLSAGGSPRARISNASYGASCVDLLTSRVRDLVGLGLSSPVDSERGVG